MLGPAKPLKILDVACGLGTHAVEFARAGHTVSGVDLSATFLERARQKATDAGVNVRWIHSDALALDADAQFDAVVWIERSFFSLDAIRRLRRYLRPGGLLVLDERNPEHPRAMARGGDWRTWQEKDGRFLLERHEVDEQARRVDCWIEIDPSAGTITEKTSTSPQTTLQERIDLIRQAGLGAIELRTLSGEPFTGGVNDYWLWLLARRPQ